MLLLHYILSFSARIAVTMLGSLIHSVCLLCFVLLLLSLKSFSLCTLISCQTAYLGRPFYSLEFSSFNMFASIILQIIQFFPVIFMGAMMYQKLQMEVLSLLILRDFMKTS